MKETRGKTSRAMKDVHPLCSRKRSLSRIIASPSYKLRQESQPAKKKKKEDAIPKFQYLVRKEQYGDVSTLKGKMATLKKKRNTVKVDDSKENEAHLQLSDVAKKVKEMGNQVSLKQSAKKGNSHPLCDRQRSLANIVASPSYKLPSRFTKATTTPLYQSPLRVVKTPRATPSHKPQRATKAAITPTQSLQGSTKVPTTPLYQSPLRVVKTPTTTPQRATKAPIAFNQPSHGSTKVSTTPYKPPDRTTKVATTPYRLPQKSLPNKTNTPLRRSSLRKSNTPSGRLLHCSFSKDVGSTCRDDRKRRYTLIPSSQYQDNKDNSMYNVSVIASPAYTSTVRKSSGKDRRRTTVAKWKPNEDKINGADGDGQGLMTPWKNRGLNMRERLELWLTAKGKSLTPSQQTFKKSPHPCRSFKASHMTKVDEEDSSETIEFVGHSSKCLSSEENSSEISKELEVIIEKFENDVDRCEIESDLADLITKYTTIVKFAGYWICKARLASLDDDVQRVICLLEQAHAFQAHPGEMIKEEICRYLELLEFHENNGATEEEDKVLEEGKDKLMALYAITPGRRVHFAVKESPVEFKSSVIRFCLLESKAFKRRLNAQLNRKVVTPVRRSLRVERSELPDFLRTDNRVITGSPGELENDIMDGDITFVPNTTLDTPLNKGWLIQDERKNVEGELHAVDENEGGNVDENVELSFM